VIQKGGLNFESLYFKIITSDKCDVNYIYYTHIVEKKMKRALHSSRRLSFNELTNAKNLVLHSSHFDLN